MFDPLEVKDPLAVQEQAPEIRGAFPEFYGLTPMESLARTYMAKALDWLEKREPYEEGKPISGENVLKSALSLIAYANPVTGLPLVAGHIVQDPLGAPGAFVEMMKQGAIQFQPIAQALIQSPYAGLPKLTEEQKRIWYEHPETGLFASGIVAGGLRGLGKGVGRVGSAAEAGAKAYTGEAFEITPKAKYRSIAQKMREGKKLNKEEIKIIQKEPEAVEFTAREEYVSELRGKLKEAPPGFKEMPLAEVTLRKEDIASMRDWMKIEQIPGHEVINWEKSLNSAEVQNLSKDAVNISRRSLNEGRDILPNEQAALLLRYTEQSHRLRDHYAKIDELVEFGNTEAAQLERLRADYLIEEMSTIQLASRARGTASGRYLRFLQNKAGEDFSFAGITGRAERAKGQKLTFEEGKKYNEYARKLEELETEIKGMETSEIKWREKVEKDIAQKVLNIEIKKAAAKKKSKTASEAILKEREIIENELREMGFRVNDISGISAEGLYKIGRYTFNYVKEGITNMVELVSAVKAKIPSLTDQDVYRAMNTRNPKYVKKVRSELQKNWDSLKRQGRMLDEIIDIIEGRFKIPKKKPTQKEVIRLLDNKLSELRYESYASGINPLKLERVVNRINSLKDQLDNQWREIKKTRKKVEKTPELIKTEEELKGLKDELKIEDEIADLKYQLDTGDFKKPVARPVRKISKEMMRKIVERNRLRTEVNATIEAQRPKGVYDRVLGAVNFMRTIKATADLSAFLRQGFLLAPSRPIKFGKAVAKAMQATFSRYKAEEIDMAIRSVPHHYLREAANLDLTSMGIGKIGAGEEVFANNFIKRMPTLPGKVVSGIINASERNYVTFLNLMRTAAFDELLIKFPNATMAEMKAWANWINVCSGRGNLGEFSGAGKILSLFFFAPRFAVSRVQVPYYFIKYLREPRIRKMVMKDIGSVSGLSIMTLVLAEMAGAEVGLDPRDADFLKIRSGNVRIDIGAGMQQPMRLAARMILGVTDTAGLTGRYLDKSQKLFDPTEAIMRYSMYKFSPPITFGRELLLGKTMVGEKTTRLTSIANAFIPLAYQDMKDAWREGGLKLTALTGGISVLGVNVAIYEDSENRTRINIRKAMYRGDIDTARKIWWEWNIKHPDSKILWEYVSKSKTKKGKTFMLDKPGMIKSPLEFMEMPLSESNKSK